MTQLERLARPQALGRYQLLARLGRGGMSDVLLARAVAAAPGALVAIKRILPALSRDAKFVELFRREGRIATRLDHRNVCRVHALDEADDTLFLVMELLRGLPWSEIVPAIPDRSAATLVRFVAGILVQACDGLDHAHGALGDDGQPQPIVHRDVSPTNLFITTEGTVKLLDFGVSKVLDDAATASGLRVGKSPYMAPEQVRREAIDTRADLFSLAVVAWEAVAGRALFDRGAPYDTLLAVAAADVPPLPGPGRAIARLDAVLRRALSRDRDQRHGSARELADDLRAAIYDHGAPMIAREIRDCIEQWVGPSLARGARDLASLLGEPSVVIGESDERTWVHERPPPRGIRLREVSLVADRPVALDATVEVSAAATEPGSTTTTTTIESAQTRRQRRWPRLAVIAAALIALIAVLVRAC